jgi:hypothetical protein
MKNVLNEIQSTIDKFNSSIPAIQQQVYDEIVNLSKELETDGKNIKTSVKNLKLLARIKTKVEKIIYSKDYEQNLKEYLKAYNTISKLQNEYFKEIDSKYQPRAITAEIKAQSVQSTIESLGRAGIANNVSEKIINNIRNNITSGASFTQFNKSLRELVLDTDSGKGLLVRYTKQISTDAINQYSANYTQVATADLDLEWYQYTGTLIETSRCFCEALVKKRYIHKSELPKIVKGEFKEFEDMDCELNENTGLPQGMIAGTTASNFAVYRGGYNCGHQLIAVSSASVPKDLIAKFSVKEEKQQKDITPKEVTQKLQDLGVQKISFKGLKDEELQKINEAIVSIPNKEAFKSLKEVFTFTRKNSIAKAFYSPSSKAISFNLSKINEGFNSKVLTWDERINNAQKSIDILNEKYLNNPKFNQNKVISTINQSKRDIAKYEQNKKSGEKELPWSISSTQKTKEDALKATFIHEFGHHLHFRNKREIDTKFFFDKNNVPTEYAKTNREEYFAEWYAHYILKGESKVPKDLLQIFKQQ